MNEPFILGSSLETEATLLSHSWYGNNSSPWNQTQITSANSGSGKWRVKFEQTGNYRIELRRWPRELGGAIAGQDSIGNGTAISGATKVRLVIDGMVDQPQNISSTDESVVFTVNITSTAPTDLKAELQNSSGSVQGHAYLAYIQPEQPAGSESTQVVALDSESKIETQGFIEPRKCVEQSGYYYSGFVRTDKCLNSSGSSNPRCRQQPVVFR